MVCSAGKLCGIGVLCQYFRVGWIRARGCAFCCVHCSHSWVSWLCDLFLPLHFKAAKESWWFICPAQPDVALAVGVSGKWGTGWCLEVRIPGFAIFYTLHSSNRKRLSHCFSFPCFSFISKKTNHVLCSFCSVFCSLLQSWSVSRRSCFSWRELKTVFANKLKAQFGF